MSSSPFTVHVPGNQRRPRCCVPIPISIYIKQPHLDTGPGDVCGSAGVRSGPFNPANVHTTTDNNKLLDGWDWVRHAASPEITALSCGGMDGWKLKRETEARLEIVTGDRDRWEMEGVRKRIGKLNKIEKSAKRVESRRDDHL